MSTRNSVFAIFIGFPTKITGKLLKKHLIFSKNVIEMVKSQYHFSKTEFRVWRYTFAYYNTKRVTTVNPDGLPPVIYREKTASKKGAA